MCRVSKLAPIQPKKASNGKSNLFYIDSHNCRGIKTPKKRREFFDMIEKRKAHVTILADTKCHLPKEEKAWKREWCKSDELKKPENDYNSFWSLGTQGRKGVAILLSPEFRERATVLEKVCDPNGRYVKLIIEINKAKYRILGLYAPNDGIMRINFIQSLHKVLMDNHDAETIIGGDHNIALDDILDRINCTSEHNDVGRVDLQYLAQVHDLEDIFRVRNPTLKRYTWFCNLKASRLDYFLTSVSLNNQIQEISNHYTRLSDHHGIRLVFRTTETPVGKGLWKMNNEHIVNDEFKQQFTTMWTNWQGQKITTLTLQNGGIWGN